jgi:hypothetical protein
VIGVIAKANERTAVEEFFQLFKTPWEHFQGGQIYDVLIVSGPAPAENHAKLIVYLCEPGTIQTSVKTGTGCIPVYLGCDGAATIRKEQRGGQRVAYLGYNLWAEVEHLLRVGQPVEQAQSPTLELHIQLLRNLVLEGGVDLAEILPVPAGYAFAATLTHDIDFIGVRQHRFDHTLAGFLFRSTVGALRDYLRGKSSLSKLARIFKAVGSLPLVHLGLAKDFWLPFDWYLKVEQGIPATYFFIPFKHTPGDKVTAHHAQRRGCAYDIGDIPAWVATLRKNGCEIGVHGIDAWRSAAKGRAELERVSDVSGSTSRGIRMHWLLQDSNTPRVLEEAGYEYDSTVGYNETIGYRAGTTQVYRPLGNRTLLELPMHIQDGALFFPQRLGLSEDEAWDRCQQLIQQMTTLGGVLTLLWHDRSHGPERFWGDFYARLVGHLRGLNVWLASAEQVVRWFRQRRAARFERSATGIGLSSQGQTIDPPLSVRTYEGGTARHTDHTWDGRVGLDLGMSKSRTTAAMAGVAG